MIDTLRAQLNERWPELRPQRPPLTGAILAGLDRTAYGNLTFIFFDENGQTAAVAKVPRAPGHEDALRREYEALGHFWATGASAVRQHAPEPLALERIHRRLVLVTSAVHGEPMTTRYHTPGHTSDPRRVEADFDAAAEWLSRFQTETFSGLASLGRDTFSRWIGAVFERYRSQVGWGAREAELLEVLSERAADLAGSILPLTGVHGDYWMGNLMIRDGRIAGVVDWEFAEPAAPPLRDVYKFPTSYGFYLDRAYPEGNGHVPGHPGRQDHLGKWSRFGDWRNLTGFGHAYFGRGWFPEQVRRFVLDQLTRLGITPALNGIFFPAFLAEQALAARDPASRKGYRSLLHAFAEERDSTWLWREEVAHERG